MTVTQGLPGRLKTIGLFRSVPPTAELQGSVKHLNNLCMFHPRCPERLHAIPRQLEQRPSRPTGHTPNITKQHHSGGHRQPQSGQAPTGYLHTIRVDRHPRTKPLLHNQHCLTHSLNSTDRPNSGGLGAVSTKPCLWFDGYENARDLGDLGTLCTARSRSMHTAKQFPRHRFLLQYRGNLWR